MEEVVKEMIEIRRDIHKHPELGFEENRTKDVILDCLNKFGCNDIRIVAKTGIVVNIHGTGPVSSSYEKKMIALRADIDALPMNENNSHLEYQSVKYE